MIEDRGNLTIRMEFSTLAEKYVRADAPLESRLRAASGAVPLEPIELASVLFALMHDADASVRTRAAREFTHLPDGICKTVLESPTHPAVLAHLARVHADDEEHLFRIVANPATDDGTVAYIASLPHLRLLETIARNQERLLRSDDIAEALGRNPLTGRATIERILGLLDPGDLASPPASEEFPHEKNDPHSAEQAIAALLGQDTAHLAGILASEQTNPPSENPRSDGNLSAALQKMSVVQKIKLARLGGREARALLVRDRNKVVASAVILSPKISESEVTAIAQSRSVAEEVLRRICANREWLRSYSVKQALVTNPKTPQISAIKFLSHLQERDLRSIAKSRDVSAAISAQARRVLQRKGQL